MTKAEFLEKIQGVYGLYNEYQKEPVVIWVAKRSEKILTAVYAEIINTWKAEFGKKIPFLPDFNEAEDRVRTKVERETQNRLRDQSLKMIEGPANKEVPFEELKAAIAQGPEAVKSFKRKYFGEAV